jgi:hypothetical protein
MIFSAVALVAFSFAGMANEKEEIKSTQETKKELNTCDKLSANVYDSWIQAGASVNYAHEQSVIAYKNCLKNPEITL